MNMISTPKAVATGQFSPPANPVLQRKCACGNHTSTGGECSSCAAKKLQKKLSIGATNDPLELEADRVADQVLASEPTHSFSNMSAPKIQRHAEQPASQDAEAPVSVERVLSGLGSPLPPTVRKDMEQRFNKDFSQVRIHTGSNAAQSAQDVNANAYTVGSNIVFNRGKFSPQTSIGKHLLAHELTHVVQQSAIPLNGSGYGNHGFSNSAPATAISKVSAPKIARQPAPGTPVSPVLGFLNPQDIAKLQAFGSADFQASINTLEKMLNVTGDLTKEGLPRQFVSTRQASGELRTFLDFVRNPNIQGLKVVPSGSGGRSPDFYYRQVDGVAGRVEVVNITTASATARAQLRPDKHGVVRRLSPTDASGVVNTVEEIDSVSKLREAIRVKVKPGSQLSSQNVNTRVAGQPMAIGGEVRVSTSHINLSRAEMDGVIRDLNAVLRNSSASKIVVDTVDAANPRAGRKLFEYARDGQGVFSFSNVRSSFATQSASIPVVIGEASITPASTAAAALVRTEEQVVGHALEDAAAQRLTSLAAQTAEKDFAETASVAFTRTATAGASRQLGKAVVPVIGAAFAIPDAWKGVQDLSHGNFVLGLGTLGVAIIDVASQGLHLTDEITVGGGTILAITIQTWAATMQFGFESARIGTRASELQKYVRDHGKLPPRKDLMDYYKLNDEEVVLLEGDISKAQRNSVTTEELTKRVRGLLAQIDANANKPLPQGVTPEGIQKERAELMKLLVALEVQLEHNRAQAATERKFYEEKRREENFDRTQQQKQPNAARTVPRLLPSPDVPQQPGKQGGSHDPFNIFSPPGAQPLNRISVDNAEIAATGFGRIRNVLVARYAQLESKHFPSEMVETHQAQVAQYVANLDRMIGEFKKKGSAEWRGVKEMERLRDAADNDDRGKLMR